MKILISVSIQPILLNEKGINNTKRLEKEQVHLAQSSIDCCYCYLVENGKVIGIFSFFLLFMFIVFKYVGGCSNYRKICSVFIYGLFYC